MFPGSRTRTLVFGEGAGADFISTELIDGVPDVHPYVGAWSSTFYPTSVHLSNPTAGAVLGNEGAEIPAYVVNGAETLVADLQTINTGFGTVQTAESSITNGFDAVMVREGAHERLNHFYRRDSWVAPYVSELVPIAVLEDLGVKQTRKVAAVPGVETRVEYFTYIPDSTEVAKEGSVPLVFIFHGNGNHAEAQAQIADWPRKGAEEGFITVSVQNHSDIGTGDDQMRTVLEYILDELPQVDSTRVYASGFSMGAAQSWALGGRHAELFAGIAPTNGAFSPEDSVGDLEMPTFYAGAELGPFNETPSKDGEPNSVGATLREIFTRNGVTDEYSFDPAADPVWGIAPTRTATFTGTFFDVDTEVSYYASAAGQEMVALGYNADATHEPLAVTTDAAWDFLQRFSRNADGTITVSTTPEPGQSPTSSPSPTEPGSPSPTEPGSRSPKPTGPGDRAAPTPAPDGNSNASMSPDIKEDASEKTDPLARTGSGVSVLGLAMMGALVLLGGLSFFLRRRV